MNSHLYNLLEALSSGHKLELDISEVPMVEINAEGIHDAEHDIMYTYSEMTESEIMDYYYKLLHGALISEIKYRTHIEQMDEPFKTLNKYREECFNFIKSLEQLLESCHNILLDAGLDLNMLNRLVSTNTSKSHIRYDVLEGPNYSTGISLTTHSAPVLFESLRDFVIERYCDETYENPNWIIQNVHKIIDHLQKDIKINTVADTQVADICKELDIFFVELRSYIKYDTFGPKLSRRITQSNTLKTFKLDDIFFQQVVKTDSDFSVYPQKPIIKALLTTENAVLHFKNYECLKDSLAAYIETEVPPVYTVKAICENPLLIPHILKDFSSYNEFCKSKILAELEETQLVELSSLVFLPQDVRILSELMSLYSLDFQLKSNDIHTLYMTDSPAVNLSELDCDIVF